MGFERQFPLIAGEWKLNAVSRVHPEGRDSEKIIPRREWDLIRPELLLETRAHRRISSLRRTVPHKARDSSCSSEGGYRDSEENPRTSCYRRISRQAPEVWDDLGAWKPYSEREAVSTGI